MAAALELLPDQMLLYLVEAGETFTGTGLTTPVTAAVAGLVIEIAEEVTGRMRGDDRATSGPLLFARFAYLSQRSGVERPNDTEKEQQ